MYLFQRIEEMAVRADDSRRSICDFVLEQKGNLASCSMQQIAEKTFTSKATVFRFAQSLGYAGWRDFLDDFLKEADYLQRHASPTDPNMPFDADDAPDALVAKLASLQKDTIDDTVRVMDYEALEQATDYLMSAQRIAVFGMSPNSILAMVFRRRMETIGRQVIVPPLDESGIVSRGLGENDCAIVISYSGNNERREPMRYVAPMKANGVRLIGITSGGENYLRRTIPCTLCISSRERLYSKIAGFSTSQSVMFLLDSLFSSVFARNFQENFDYKVSNSRDLERRRSASLISMAETDQEPSSEGATTDE